MNKVMLIGRLTRDPELKFTNGSGIAVASFTIAVDRTYTDKNGEKEADFIPIICWRKLAETVANNLGKGRLIAVSGSMQTRTYDAKDGTKRYVTEVIADSVQFLDRKATQEKSEQNQAENNNNTSFTPVDGDEDIPF